MTQTIYIFLIVLLIEPQFDLKKIEINGLPYRSSKEEIIRIFGEPKINFPNYECGFHSEEQDGGPYYQLIYPDIIFIGSDLENFQFEKIEINLNKAIIVKYNGQLLNHETTIEDFVKIIGPDAEKLLDSNQNEENILIYSNNSDDGAFFSFRNRKLIEIQYWSPC